MKTRPRTFNQEENYVSWQKINLTEESYGHIFEFAKKSRIREKFRFSKNCSMHARDMLMQAGIKDIIGITPQLLKFSLEHPNFMKGLKAEIINSGIQTTTKKSKE